MKRVLLAVLLATAVLPPAAAAPRARNPSECEFLWDVALTARGMAMAGVDQERGRAAIWRIFRPFDAVQTEIMEAIVVAAFRTPPVEAENAAVFAGNLKRTCITRKGDMDSILGTSL